MSPQMMKTIREKDVVQLMITSVVCMKRHIAKKIMTGMKIRFQVSIIYGMD